MYLVNMIWQRYLYYFLLACCFFLSLFKLKGGRNFLILFFLFLFSISTELWSELVLFKGNENKFLAYHLYIILEYSLVTYFFSNAFNQTWLRRIMIGTIPMFILFSLFFSFSKNSLNALPAVQYIGDGVLTLFWSILVLFNMPVSLERKLSETIFFWMAIAFMILHSGQFFMTGLYNYLYSKNASIADRLANMIYYGVNYMFYTISIIGMICSNQKPKYTTQF
jgi:hypothetical protein